MNFKSYQLLKWSVSAELEEHPELHIDQERFAALEKVCDTIDRVADSGAAAAIGANVDEQTGEPIISVRFPAIFTTGVQKHSQKSRACIRIIK